MLTRYSTYKFGDFFFRRLGGDFAGQEIVRYIGFNRLKGCAIDSIRWYNQCGHNCESS